MASFSQPNPLVCDCPAEPRHGRKVTLHPTSFAGLLIQAMSPCTMPRGEVDGNCENNVPAEVAVIDAQPRQGKDCWWSIVWCHERCHKGENDVHRQRLQDSALLYGASLICLKKARQFGTWLEQNDKPLYALVTDWREAQPCADAILAACENQPILMAVLCDSERQVNRAKLWARRLDLGVCTVYVCERSKIPASLLGGLLREGLGEGGEAEATSSPEAGTSEALPPLVLPLGKGGCSHSLYMSLPDFSRVVTLKDDMIGDKSCGKQWELDRNHGNVEAASCSSGGGLKTMHTCRDAAGLLLGRLMEMPPLPEEVPVPFVSLHF